MVIPAEGGSTSAAVYHSIPNADVDRDGPLPEGSGNGNGNGEQQVLIQKEGTGTASLLSCISNLSNTILGTGMLALPHSIASCGLIPGILLICISGAMSFLGLHFLSRSASLVRPNRTASFNSLASMTYPRATVLFDAAIAIKCAGVSTSYLIIIGGLMPRVILSFDHTPPDWALDRRLWITVSMAILTPLCYLRHLNSLRYTSYVALVAVFDLILVVVYKFISPVGLPPRAPVHLFVLHTSVIGSIPVYVFAFTCAQNLFSCFNELRDNSKERMTMVTGFSIGGSALIYQLIGILGYLTFGDTVPSNVMTGYHDSLFINICRAGIVIFILFSYPLQILPCRASLSHLFASSTPSDGAVKHIVLTTFILMLTFLIAINVSQLELVLGIIGSTGSVTISFLLPSLFYLKLFPESEWRGARTAARALLGVGVVIMIVCLIINIWHAVYGR